MDNECIEVWDGVAYDMSRTIPVEKQLWRDRLYVVCTASSRLVGLCESGVKKMYGTMTYEPPRLDVQPNGTGGMRISTVIPPLLLPYDTLGPATVLIRTPEVILHVAAQPESIRDFFFRAYQNYFSPPRVQPAGDIITKPR